MTENEDRIKKLAVNFTCVDGKSVVFGDVVFVDFVELVRLGDNRDVRTQRVLT